jgi:hypothetical protein
MCITLYENLKGRYYMGDIGIGEKILKLNVTEFS